MPIKLAYYHHGCRAIAHRRIAHFSPGVNTQYTISPLDLTTGEQLPYQGQILVSNSPVRYSPVSNSPVSNSPYPYHHRLARLARPIVLMRLLWPIDLSCLINVWSATTLIYGISCSKYLVNSGQLPTDLCFRQGWDFSADRRIYTFLVSFCDFPRSVIKFEGGGGGGGLVFYLSAWAKAFRPWIILVRQVSSCFIGLPSHPCLELAKNIGIVWIF